MHVAGGTPDRVRFSREAIDAVYDASGGVPRLINRICDRALHHGHLSRLAVIDGATVSLAAGEMEPLPTDFACAPIAPIAPTEPIAPAEPSRAKSDAEWFARIDASVERAAESDPVTIDELHPLRIAPMTTRGHRATLQTPLYIPEPPDDPVPAPQD